MRLKSVWLVHPLPRPDDAGLASSFADYGHKQDVTLRSYTLHLEGQLVHVRSCKNERVLVVPLANVAGMEPHATQPEPKGKRGA